MTHEPHNPRFYDTVRGQGEDKRTQEVKVARDELVQNVGKLFALLKSQGGTNVETFDDDPNRIIVHGKVGHDASKTEIIYDEQGYTEGRAQGFESGDKDKVLVAFDEVAEGERSGDHMGRVIRADGSITRIAMQPNADGHATQVEIPLHDVDDLSSANDYLRQKIAEADQA